MIMIGDAAKHVIERCRRMAAERAATETKFGDRSSVAAGRNPALPGGISSNQDEGSVSDAETH
jgi:hypothetical protein